MTLDGLLANPLATHVPRVETRGGHQLLPNCTTPNSIWKKQSTDIHTCIPRASRSIHLKAFWSGVKEIMGLEYTATSTSWHGQLRTKNKTKGSSLDFWRVTLITNIEVARVTIVYVKDEKWEEGRLKRIRVRSLEKVRLLWWHFCGDRKAWGAMNGRDWPDWV